MKNRVQKYERGYLSSIKKKFILRTILFIGIGLVIFVIGLLLNKMQPRNVFTVLAVLMVLPMAKNFVEVITLFPFKPLSDAEADKAEKAAAGKGLLLHNVAFTSSERPMYAELIGVFPGRLLVYRKPTEKEKADASKKKQDEKYVTDYLSTHLRNQGLNQKAVLYDDLDHFIKAFPAKAMDASDEASVKALAESMEYFVI